MSAKFEVRCFKKPYGGGCFSHFYNTIQEARSKRSDLLCTLPPWYDVEIIPANEKKEEQ